VAQTDNETRVTSSVLRRLLEPESDAGRRPSRSPTQSVRELKEDVCKDLEDLLNTHRIPKEFLGGDKEAVREAVEKLVVRHLAEPERPPEVGRLDASLLSYGLPDLTVFNLKNKQHREQLEKALAEAIRLFEPRLLGARATIEYVRQGENSLRIRIDAHLMVEPVLERVSFNTSLQPHNGQFEVEKE
jgi:type VI secretion system lysozyme-like protein